MTQGEDPGDAAKGVFTAGGPSYKQKLRQEQEEKELKEEIKKGVKKQMGY